MEPMKFAHGRIVTTPGALSVATAAVLGELLGRHLRGDWGDLDDEDKRTNEYGLRFGTRLLSAYNLPGGKRLWIITEWDRSVTTLLLPDEY